MSTKEVVEKNLLEQQGQGQAEIRGIYGSIEDLKDMGTVCVPQHGVKATLMPGGYNPFVHPQAGGRRARSGPGRA